MFPNITTKALYQHFLVFSVKKILLSPNGFFYLKKCRAKTEMLLSIYWIIQRTLRYLRLKVMFIPYYPPKLEETK